MVCDNNINMLTRLNIRDVVLIESLSLSFVNGLCCLTGETGAGKSILLDSLGLALGGRAEARLVRAGCDKAQVTAEFELPPEHPAFEFLKQQDIDLDDTLIIRRSLGSDGRSKAFINDQAISIGLLAQLGAHLAEIHGQFETQGLLNPATHRMHLDAYAQCEDLIKDTACFYEDWRTTETALSEAQETAEQARAEEEFLRDSVQDLDALDIQENEEEELTALRTRLMNREQVMEALNTAYHALNGEQDPVAAAARALDRIADKAGEAVTPAIEALHRATSEVQEALSQIEACSNDLAEGGPSLQEIDDRLFALKAQARKHQCTIEELPAKRDELAGQLTLIESTDDILSDLIKKTNEARKHYVACAEDLSQRRKQAAEKLDKGVAQELPPLKMEKARFVTEITPLQEENWGPGGIDQVRFLVATNPGNAPGPLGKIASGGELSRFMLALKVILTETGSVATIIFDEVDSGIGGATADAVGERLARLSAHPGRQVLVVTHSPQVAARAAAHYIVRKEGNADQVTTQVHALEDEQSRREEIARMLAGAEITDAARQAADSLLENRAA